MLAETLQQTLEVATPIADETEMLVLETQSDDLHMHLAISPGTVGDNTFAITLHDLANHLPVVTASLIRLRFQDVEMQGGENELRITEGANGTYTGAGPYLSMPGEWRIRATIQRPDAFDVVGDFEVMAEARPPAAQPVQPSRFATTPEVAWFVAAMLTALTLMAVGIAIVANARVRLRSGEGAVALLLLLSGSAIFAFAALG